MSFFQIFFVFVLFFDIYELISFMKRDATGPQIPIPVGMTLPVLKVKGI